MSTRALMVAGLAAAVTACPMAASAAAPQRTTTTDPVHEVVGSCGPRDDLVGDYSITQTITTYDSGRQTLRLELVGTITRTGTGVVGAYRERQRDVVELDGTERYTGLLGHLVVRGGGGFTFAGQVRVGADGTVQTTRGVAGLVDLDFPAVACAALAG